jgi:P27 family predicted phage terminase small subunit
MSRRPKPTALKELEGNPGNRILNHEEPKPKLGYPERPRGLSFCAQREFGRICDLLNQLHLLAETDGKALAMYCDAYADWEDANRKCRADGNWTSEPIINKEGDVVGVKEKVAPWFMVKVTAMKVMKSYLIEFGLTPASRSKLKIEKSKAPEDEGLLSRDAAGAAQANDEPDLSAIDETVIN